LQRINQENELQRYARCANEANNKGNLFTTANWLVATKSSNSPSYHTRSAKLAEITEYIKISQSSEAELIGQLKKLKETSTAEVRSLSVTNDCHRMVSEINSSLAWNFCANRPETSSRTGTRERAANPRTKAATRKQIKAV